MLKRVSPMNPRDANLAVLLAKMAELHKKKCLQPDAHPAAAKQEFLSSPEKTVLFIAATAFQSKDNFCLK